MVYMGEKSSTKSVPKSVQRELNARDGQIELLQEELATVRAMMDYDELGWTSLGNFDSMPGPSLQQNKADSIKIREMAVGAPLIKRALALRHSYIWSKGIIVPGIDDDPGIRDGVGADEPEKPKKRGRPTKEQTASKQLEEFWRKPLNQKAIASSEAHEQMEKAAGTDGVYLLLGDEETKELRSIPLYEITGFLTNPNFNDEIWAYRRAWQPDPNSTTVRVRWIYTDQFTGQRATQINDGTTSNAVERNWTILDQWVNKQVGWPLGTSDALPAIQYARTYIELIQDGRKMTNSLAKLVGKVKSVSKSNSNAVGVKFGSGGAGQVGTYGEGQDIDIFQAAGKTYDFNGLRPIAALVATGLEVSIVHLLSDPGAAGSSYGSAANLDTPTKRAMVARQNLWAAYIERVVLWGTGQKLNVSFPSLDDPDPYREIQARVLGWGTGLVHEDEMRPEILKSLGIQSRHDAAPDGVMLPNNSDAQTKLAGDSAVATQAASPDQGQSNGTGGGGSTAADDQRTDTIESLMGIMQATSLIERLEAALSKLEN